MKSDYNFFFHYGTLVLQDSPTSRGMSLTNNMENVLQDIENIVRVPLRGKKIIYRDSEGMYDRVIYRKSGSIDFSPIRTKDLQQALKEVEHG